MILAPVSPLHKRLGALAARHPRLWYDQHLDDDRQCWCDEDAADPLCDIGEALWRLARQAEPESRACFCGVCCAKRTRESPG